MVPRDLPDDRIQEGHERALQIKRTLNIAYETAWYLCHRIRAAMREINAELLRGVVEVDETYVGGKVRGMGRGYKGNKAIAIGAVQREGKIRLQVITHADKATLHKFIHDNTAPDTEAIYTDELPAYWGIEDADTSHRVGSPPRRGMGCRRRSHQRHRERLEPAQALHHRFLS